MSGARGKAAEQPCPWRGGVGFPAIYKVGVRRTSLQEKATDYSFSETTHVWHSCANSADECTIQATRLEKNYVKGIIKMLK